MSKIMAVMFVLMFIMVLAMFLGDALFMWSTADTYIATCGSL